MNTRTSTLYVFGIIAMLGLAYACTTPQPTQTMGQESPIVGIDRETHFLTPAGEDVVVLPGAYLVQAEKEGIRLTAEEGTSSESMVINATSQTHEQKISGPTALSVSEQEDEQIVMLLLPDGKSWEATGSHSGVISRAAPRRRTPQSRIRQVINKKLKVPNLKQPLKLSAMSVRYPTLDKTFQGSQNRTSWRLPVSDTVDAASFTFVWAGSPTPPAQIPAIKEVVDKKSCCLNLSIDGEPHSWPTPTSKLRRPPMMKTTFSASFDRGGNLVTTVHLANVRSKQWPKNIKLSVGSGKAPWQSAESKVYANTVSYYTSELHPIFSDARCTTCHSLGDQNAIVTMHQSRIGQDSYPNDPQAKPQNPTFCANCHAVPDWRSPNFAQGIHWQGKSAGQVCSIVTGPFIDSAGTQHPPFGATEFQHHFHDDPRILWAVADGAKPFVLQTSVDQNPTLPVLFPGNLNAWFAKVDPWVDAGTPCPKSLFFQIPGRIQPGQLIPQRR